MASRGPRAGQHPLRLGRHLGAQPAELRPAPGVDLDASMSAPFQYRAPAGTALRRRRRVCPRWPAGTRPRASRAARPRAGRPRRRSGRARRAAGRRPRPARAKPANQPRPSSSWTHSSSWATNAAHLARSRESPRPPPSTSDARYCVERLRHPAIRVATVCQSSSVSTGISANTIRTPGHRPEQLVHRPQVLARLGYGPAGVRSARRAAGRTAARPGRSAPAADARRSSVSRSSLVDGGLPGGERSGNGSRPSGNPRSSARSGSSPASRRT